MGISPVTYDKTVGTHTISLRKSGYQTKSYQIEVTDDDRDLVYSFPDLEKNINENTDASNTGEFLQSEIPGVLLARQHGKENHWEDVTS